MNTPKVIFAGTPDFAVAALRALVDVGITPAAVLTQPDRPAGRGKRLAQSPVKQYAATQGLVVLQPPTLRDEAAVAELVALKPDILIVAAYGLILPQNVLDVPTAGCLNVHASLLPRWRGAAPIQAAILAGDDETGVCLMSMTAGLDCGPVYVSETVAIGEHETAGELHDRLAKSGAELLTRHLDAVLGQRLEPKAQDESQATYAPKTKPADAELDWKRTAVELERMIRAYDPVPGAWFMLDDARIKCRQAQQVGDVEAPAGTIVAAGPEGIVISCGEGAIGINSLQKPGKRSVTAVEFATQFDLVGRRL
jgi:methionyl-tRNA formyltransferase